MAMKHELPYPISPGIDFQSRKFRNSHRPLFQASTSIISDTMGDFDFREWFGSSMVWRHFLRNTDGSKAKCNHCGTELKTGEGSTKGLNTHKKTKHNEILAPPVTEESATTLAKKMKRSKRNYLQLRPSTRSRSPSHPCITSAPELST